MKDTPRLVLKGPSLSPLIPGYATDRIVNTSPTATINVPLNRKSATALRRHIIQYDMKAVVTRPYERPYENPISVAAGEAVVPDFAKRTNLKGWVWCTSQDGRSGWTPRNWLVKSGAEWHVNRDFNAIELTITPGETLQLAYEENGFFWATKENGETGWVPAENVLILRS